MKLKSNLYYFETNNRNLVLILQYPEYLNLVLPKVNSGGYILADNVLWDGKVLLPEPDDAYTKGVMEFNKMVSGNPNLQKVLLPLRDGLMIIRKQ